MQRYLLRRFLTAIPTIFGITVLIFVAMRVLPGDPIAQIAGEGQGQYTLTEAELQSARASLGLDKPLPLQYAILSGPRSRSATRSSDGARSRWRSPCWRSSAPG